MSEKLKNRDFFVLVDKSGSMSDSDTPSGQTRYKYAEESTIALAKKLEEFDPDGITVIPFSSTFKVYDNQTAGKVKDVFAENDPMGGTVLTGPLKHCFDAYLKEKKAGTAKANGAMVVVITDGQPQDEGEVGKSIIEFTKKLDSGDDEFGILFLQVGKDPGAKKFLEKLDDNLNGAKFDIVDAKTMDDLENLGLTEALMGALND